MKQFFIDLTISRFLAKKKIAYMIAYIALLVAISAISNMFLEIKLFDTQFSLTITISAMIGYIAGPIMGFAVCMLGDLLGYLVNGGGMYYFWVALSTGAFALIAGLLSMKKSKNPLTKYLKMGLFCIISFVVCTVGINSLGFYLFNMNVGFSATVKDFVASAFGGENVTFFAYVCYRLFFKLQILNSVFNYALLFVLFTTFYKIKPLEAYFEV